MLTRTKGLFSQSTPPIRWYWGNNAITAFGDSIGQIAILLIVLQVTGSVAAMATMSIVVAVPSIAFGILSGVWVDAWDPKRVVVISQLVRAALFLLFIYVDIWPTIVPMYFLAFAEATIGTFDDPARAKVARSITTDENRLSVNSFGSSSKMVFSIAGTTAAGFLAGGLDIYWPSFLVSSCAFLASALVFSRITIGESIDGVESAAVQPVAFWTRMTDGLRVIKQSRVLTAVILAASAGTLGTSAATILLLPFVKDTLGVSPAWFGAVEAAQSIAMILASLTVAIYGDRLKPPALVAISLLVTGLGISLLSTTRSLVELLLVMFLLGLAIAPLGAGYSTLAQTHCPREALGRVGATLTTAIQTVRVVAMGIGGFAGELIGIRPAIFVAGSVCVVASVIAWMLLRGAVHDNLRTEPESMPSASE